MRDDEFCIEHGRDFMRSDKGPIPYCEKCDDAERGKQSAEQEAERPRRELYWRWPTDGQTWFLWAFQNYGSNWVSWRVGPINYRVELAKPGKTGGYIRSVH